MSALLTLLQDELGRLLPQLRAWQAGLAGAADPALEAQWQRRIEAFRGATAVFPDTPLPALAAWLQTAWVGADPRAGRAAQVEAALQALDAFAGSDPSAAPASLAALQVPADDSAIAPAEPVVDARLRTLFVSEVEEKTSAMGRVLLQLERQPDRLELIAPLMRAAHSIKGAARAVRCEAAVQLAHALEGRLSAAQRHGHAIDAATADLALRCVDQLARLARQDDPDNRALAAELVAALAARRVADAPAREIPAVAAGDYIDAEDAEAVLRVRASQIGRVIALAASGLVESRRLQPFAARQQRLRRQVTGLTRQLDELTRRLGAPPADSPVGTELFGLRQGLAGARRDISDWLEQFSEYTRDALDLTERLYEAAAQTRLRPFEEIAGSYPRSLRDLARQLGKKARLELVGEQLAVDRDVLERLDAPLTHLLRNAIDHGIESPAQRRASGKPEEGVISITASYRAGLLAIELADDGAGVDFERLRARLVASGRLDAAEAAALNTDELQDFLFSAGVSTRDDVSEISGRGVGLDVVRQMLKQLDGSVRISSAPGRGTRFNLLLPISRVVTRALVVDVAEELYAFPLLRLDSIRRVPVGQLQDRHGAAYFSLDGLNIGLVPLAEQLELGGSRPAPEFLDVVVVSQQGRSLGWVVDAIVGEYDLASRPLDKRLGRVADVAAVAVLPDGRPVVLLDLDDLAQGALERQRVSMAPFREQGGPRERRRVLVVDDSISVRELERQILAAHGYRVDVAVDGMDAWARLRGNDYELVVTDVDMPRMDGIELTRSIKQDARLRGVPVVIVSYRDRPEDRARGLEARADAYLTKGDFQEDRLLQTVHDLIGPAEADA